MTKVLRAIWKLACLGGWLLYVGDVWRCNLAPLPKLVCLAAIAFVCFDIFIELLECLERNERAA